MCLRTGGVKLLDFGIAKVFGEASVDQTQHGLFKGKLAYVPPERIKNAPLDGRGDLFALGVVLWEMLAGRRLFRGKDELATLTNVMEKVVPPPSSLNPDVPESLDRIVLHAVARDPDQRYATGQEMADDLDEVLRETKFSQQDAVGSDPRAVRVRKLEPGRHVRGDARAAGEPRRRSSPDRDRDRERQRHAGDRTALVGAAPPGGGGDRGRRRRGGPGRARADAGRGGWLTSESGELSRQPAAGGDGVIASLPSSIPCRRRRPRRRRRWSRSRRGPKPPRPRARPTDDASAAKPEPAHRRAHRHKVRAERDRVLRGLSIDPFSGAAR